MSTTLNGPTSTSVLPKAGTYGSTRLTARWASSPGTSSAPRSAAASPTSRAPSPWPRSPRSRALEAVVQAASIQTNQAQRDDHLRTNDFLDVPNHPTLAMKSTGLRRVDDANWVLTVDLTDPRRHQVGGLRPRVPRRGPLHGGGPDGRGLLGPGRDQPPGLRGGLQPFAARRQRGGRQQGGHRARGRGRTGGLTAPDHGRPAPVVIGGPANRAQAASVPRSRPGPARW